jgi:hypothetical protein
MGLSYRPARLHRLAELIPWNRFLGSFKVFFKIWAQISLEFIIESVDFIKDDNHVGLHKLSIPWIH